MDTVYRDEPNKQMQRPPHVLVLDPDARIQDMFQLILNALGATMSRARDVAHARAIIDAGAVNFAYISLTRGQEKHGIGLANHATANGIHIVVMSGHPEGIASGLNSGYPLLRKPMRLSDII